MTGPTFKGHLCHRVISRNRSREGSRRRLCSRLAEIGRFSAIAVYSASETNNLGQTLKCRLTAYWLKEIYFSAKNRKPTDPRQPLSRLQGSSFPTCRLWFPNWISGPLSCPYILLWLLNFWIEKFVLVTRSTRMTYCDWFKGIVALITSTNLNKT